MALKDRFRRAIGRSSPDSSSTSSFPLSSPLSSSTSSGSSTPSSKFSNNNTLNTVPTTNSNNMPAITLTKTSSRLSKITSFRSNREQKKREKLVEPRTKYPGVKNTKHQEMLRAFEWKFGREGRPSLDGRWSCYSGISPMASRNVSVDEGATHRVGGLSRQVSRTEEHEVETVAEE